MADKRKKWEDEPEEKVSAGGDDVVAAADAHAELEAEAKKPEPKAEAAPEPKKTKAIKPAAIVAWFQTPADLYKACEALRDAGYKHFDAHTPFPVHGLEVAMGLRPSILGWIVLGGGFTGIVSAFGMQYWMSAVDYPLNISGKPLASWPAWVPIGFELTVLLSAFACFFGMWALNGLPKFFDPVMQHTSFDRASNDRFFISIEAKDAKFGKGRAMLEKLGANDIEEVLP